MINYILITREMIKNVKDAEEYLSRLNVDKKLPSDAKISVFLKLSVLLFTNLVISKSNTSKVTISREDSIHYNLTDTKHFSRLSCSVEILNSITEKYLGFTTVVTKYRTYVEYDLAVSNSIIFNKVRSTHHTLYFKLHEEEFIKLPFKLEFFGYCFLRFHNLDIKGEYNFKKQFIKYTGIDVSHYSRDLRKVENFVTTVLGCEIDKNHFITGYKEVSRDKKEEPNANYSYINNIGKCFCTYNIVSNNEQADKFFEICSNNIMSNRSEKYSVLMTMLAYLWDSRNRHDEEHELHLATLTNVNSLTIIKMNVDRFVKALNSQNVYLDSIKNEILIEEVLKKINFSRVEEGFDLIWWLKDKLDLYNRKKLKEEEDEEEFY